MAEKMTATTTDKHNEQHEATTSSTTTSVADVAGSTAEATTTNHQEGGGAISASIATSHPLHHVWVLWYDSPATGKRVSQDRWFSNMKKIAHFSSVEEFWGIFNNIRPPSRLVTGSNYYLFKKGIQPMWEDASNEQGGKWTFSIPKKYKDGIDEVWLSLILAVIGENFDEGEDICGAVASTRRQQDRVSVWTRRWNDERVCMSIGVQMKQCLELGQGQQISYVAHSDALKQRATSKSRYEI